MRKYSPVLMKLQLWLNWIKKKKAGSLMQATPILHTLCRVCVREWCTEWWNLPFRSRLLMDPRKHVFFSSPVFWFLPAVHLLCATSQPLCEAADQNRSSAEWKPALWSKRITAEHHPVSIARWKSYLTLRRTDWALCALRPHWPYCGFAYCTKW